MSTEEHLEADVTDPDSPLIRRLMKEYFSRHYPRYAVAHRKALVALMLLGVSAKYIHRLADDHEEELDTKNEDGWVSNDFQAVATIMETMQGTIGSRIAGFGAFNDDGVRLGDLLRELAVFADANDSAPDEAEADPAVTVG